MKVVHLPQPPVVVVDRWEPRWVTHLLLRADGTESLIRVLRPVWVNSTFYSGRSKVTYDA